MSKIVRTKQAGDAWATTVEPEGGSGNSAISQHTATVTSAELKTLLAAQVDIVPAVPDKIIMPIYIEYVLEFNSIAYTVEDFYQLGWRWGDGGKDVSSDTFIGAAPDLFRATEDFLLIHGAVRDLDTKRGNLSLFVDKPITLVGDDSNGDPVPNVELADGDSPLLVIVTYDLFSPVGS